MVELGKPKHASPTTTSVWGVHGQTSGQNYAIVAPDPRRDPPSITEPFAVMGNLSGAYLVAIVNALRHPDAHAPDQPARGGMGPARPMIPMMFSRGSSRLR
jgi:hypothetical protein